MDAVSFVSSRKTGGFLTKSFLRFALGFSFALLAVSQAAAQYGGGSGTMGGGTPSYTPPKGGYGSAKGVGIGVGAAAGAGVLFFALHHRGHLTGCIQPAEDGLRFLDEKKNESYDLLPGEVDLKAGQRVELKGQKSNSKAGAQTFKAQKLIKDLGACGTSSSTSSSDGPAR